MHSALFFFEVITQIWLLDRRIWARSCLCEVIGDLNYRHLLSQMYIQSPYSRINHYYREINATRSNNFMIVYGGFASLRRVINGDKFSGTNRTYFQNEERVFNCDSFFFFQCNERECRCLLSFYDVLNIIRSHNLLRFLIIIIGRFHFLNLCEEVIYLNNPDIWFSLYQSNSPSYFICYNTLHPTSLGTMLEIDEDSVRLFL